MSNVRNYKDTELLDRVRSLKSFKAFPSNYWLLGVRSDEDQWNRFDDKFYLFKGKQFIATWKGTTNAGTDLLHPSNPRGEAVLKSDEIYYDSHERRKHRGKVLAYCQRIPLPIFRDADRDKRIEEIGIARNENVGINIHPSSYIIGNHAEREAIGEWSQGCQVFAIRSDFDEFMSYTEDQHVLTYCLLKEFTPSPFTGITDQEIQDSVAAASLSEGSEPRLADLAVDASAETADAPPPGLPEPTPQVPVQNAENITNVGLGSTVDGATAKVDAVASRFQAFQGVMDKFGFADPTAKSSLGTVVIVVGKILLAPIIFIWGVYEKYPEYAIPVSIALVVAAVWLWNKSKDRVAAKQAGMPVALAQQIIDKGAAK